MVRFHRLGELLANTKVRCYVHLGQQPRPSFDADRGRVLLADYDVLVVWTDGTTPALAAIFIPVHPLPSRNCERGEILVEPDSAVRLNQRKLGLQYLR